MDGLAGNYLELFKFYTTADFPRHFFSKRTPIWFFHVALISESCYQIFYSRLLAFYITTHFVLKMKMVFKAPHWSVVIFL